MDPSTLLLGKEPKQSKWVAASVTRLNQCQDLATDTLSIWKHAGDGAHTVARHPSQYLSALGFQNVEAGTLSGFKTFKKRSRGAFSIFKLPTPECLFARLFDWLLPESIWRIACPVHRMQHGSSVRVQQWQTRHLCSTMPGPEWDFGLRIGQVCQESCRLE